jgi:hypothetical protein
MSDRSAVVTTLNGKIVDWQIFDDPQQAYGRYNEGVGHLRGVLQRSSEEGDWEIMLVDIKQYALSKPHREKQAPTAEEADWYTRYLTAMTDQARKLGDLPKMWSLDLWLKLKHGVGHRLTKTEEEPVRLDGP